jgi:tetratricopeptide (TPR) repeat protein
VAYFEKGDYPRTIANWTIIIGLDPSQAYGYVGRALAFRDAGDYDRAKADLDKAKQLEKG